MCISITDYSIASRQPISPSASSSSYPISYQNHRPDPIKTPFIPDEHASDRLRKQLIEKELIDVFANPQMLLKCIPLPLLNDAIMERIKGYYLKSRTIKFEDLSGNLYSVEYNLKSLFDYFRKYFKYPDPLEIVGGVLVNLLGFEYFQEYLKYLSIEQPDSFLSELLGSQFLKPAADEDYRPHFSDADWTGMEIAGNVVISYFTYEFCNKYPSFNPNKETYQLIKNHIFRKFYHFPKKAEDLKSDSLIHYLILSTGDINRTEICLTAKIVRRHLFFHDALALDLTDLMQGVEKGVFLKSDLPSLHTSLIFRLLGVLDADKIEEIDEMGWPLFISHIMRGKVCLKEEVERQLTCAFFDNFFKANAGLINSLIDKIYKNHHCDYIEGQFREMRHTLPLYHFTLLNVAKKYAAEEEFGKLKQSLISNLSNSSAETFYATLGRLLKSERLTFDLLSSFIQLFGLFYYMNGDTLPDGSSLVVLRGYCQGVALQIKISEGGGMHTLLSPLETGLLFAKIDPQIDAIDAKDLDDLLLLWSTMSAGCSGSSHNNRFQKYACEMKLNVHEMIIQAIKLMVKLPLPLRPILKRCIALFSAIPVENSLLDLYLKNFPMLINSCSDLDGRICLCDTLIQLLDRYGKLSASDPLAARMAMLAANADFSNDQCIEELFLAISRSGSQRLYSAAFTIFQYSRSHRLGELIASFLPGNIDMVIRSLEHIDRRAIPVNQIVIALSYLLAYPLNEDWIDLIFDILSDFLQRNEPEIDREIIPFYLRFIDAHPSKLLPKESLVILERAQGLTLTIADLPLYENFKTRCLTESVQNKEDVLSEASLEIFSEAGWCEAIFRNDLKEVEDALNSNGSVDTKVCNHFLLLLQTSLWQSHIDELVRLFKLINDKFFQTKTHKSQKVALIPQFVQFLLSPILENLYNNAPKIVFEPVLCLLETLPSKMKQQHFDRLTTLCLRFLPTIKDAGAGNLNILQRFVAILEMEMPREGLRRLLMPSVTTIADSIQSLGSTDLLIRFFKVCDIQGILTEEPEQNMHYCMRAFSSGIESNAFDSYVRIVRRLLERMDLVPVEEMAAFEQFMAYLFDIKSDMFKPEDCCFWLSQFSKHSMQIGASPCKIVALLRNIEESRDLSILRQVWPLVTEVFEEMAIFKDDWKLKAEAYLIAVRCLERTDSGLCFELLCSRNSLIVSRFDHADAFDFIVEFYLIVLKRVASDIKMPLGDDDLPKLKLLLHRQHDLMRNYDCINEGMINLCIYLIERFSKCANLVCHEYLWISFFILVKYTEYSRPGLLALYKKLCMSVTEPLCIKEKFLSNFTFVTSCFLEQLPNDFELPSIFHFLQRCDYPDIGSTYVMIVDHIQNLIGSGVTFKAFLTPDFFGKSIIKLISMNEFHAVDYILNTPFIKDIFKKELKVGFNTSSSSCTKERRPNRKRVTRNKSDGVDQSMPITYMHSLKSALFDEIIIKLYEISRNPLEYDKSGAEELLKKAMHLFINMFSTVCDYEKFNSLLRVFSFHFEIHKDLEKHIKKIESVFQLICNLLELDHKEVAADDSIIQYSDGSNLLQNSTSSFSSSSSSSSSNPPNPASQILSRILFSNFLRKFDPYMKDDSDEYLKKLVYSKFIIEMAKFVWSYVSEDCKINAFNLRLGWQILVYFHEEFQDSLSELCIEKLLSAFFIKQSSFMNETLLFEHHERCRHLLELYSDHMGSRICLTNVVMEPSLALELRKRENFGEEIYKILSHLLSFNTNLSLSTVLEIFNHSMMEVFLWDIKSWEQLYFDIISATLDSPYYTFRGYSNIDRLIGSLFLKQSISIERQKLVYSLQGVLLKMMLKKNRFDSFSDEVKVIHFKTCVGLMVKHFSSGGFCWDTSERFGHYINLFKEVYIHLQNNISDSKFCENVTSMMKIMKNSCLQLFPINGHLQKEFAEIIDKELSEIK
jgi:hypothetical protein